MGIWNQSADDNNGVEVNYTGKNLYHLTCNNGSYDEKIETKSDGTTHHYKTESDWDDHSHDVYNSSGDKVYSRLEGYNHPWQTRDDD